MKRTIKRALSMLLTFAMILSMVWIPAYADPAEETMDYAHFDIGELTLTAEPKAGDVIKLPVKIEGMGATKSCGFLFDFEFGEGITWHEEGGNVVALEMADVGKNWPSFFVNTDVSGGHLEAWVKPVTALNDVLIGYLVFELSEDFDGSNAWISFFAADIGGPGFDDHENTPEGGEQDEWSFTFGGKVPERITDPKTGEVTGIEPFYPVGNSEYVAPSVKATASKKEVAPGEEFTVEVSVVGTTFAAVDFEYVYDKDLFELTKTEMIQGGENYGSYFFYVCMTEDGYMPEGTVVMTLTFKAKEQSSYTKTGDFTFEDAYYVKDQIEAATGDELPIGIIKDSVTIKGKIDGTVTLPTFEDYVYDGTAHDYKAVTTTVPGAEIKYALSPDGPFVPLAELTSECIDAGEYTVYFQITADGYYDYSGSYTMTIAKAQVALSVNDDECTYAEAADGRSTDYSDRIIVAPALTEGMDKIVATATVASTGKDGNAYCEPDVYDIVISYNAEDNKNYEITGTTDGKLTVKESRIIGYDFTKNPDLPETYDGVEYPIAVKPSVENPTDGVDVVWYVYDEENDQWVEWTGETDEDGIPVVRDAGDYKFKYEATKDGYTPVEGTIEFSIERATIIFTAEDAYYNFGDVFPSFPLTPDGELGYNDNLMDIITEAGVYPDCEFDPAEDGEGTYPIVVHVTTNPLKNYIIETNNGTLYVTKGSMSSQISAEDMTDLVYDGQDHEFEVSVDDEIAEEVTVSYEISTDGGETWTKVTAGELPSFIDAGTYLVKWTATRHGYADVTGQNTVTIAPKPVTVTPSVSNKVYDGNNTATISGAVTAAGVTYETITVTGLTASFADKNAADGKAVSFSASAATVSVTGGQAKASNYTISYATDVTADITAKTVTVTGIKANDKDYDGTTAVTFDYTAVAIDGKVDGDELSVTASGAFASANASAEPIAISGFSFSLAGKDAGNYVLAESGNQTSASAKINPVKVTVTPVVKGKTYDGKTDAVIDSSSLTVSGVNGETITVSGLTAAFDSADVAANGNNTAKIDVTNKVITVTGGNALASNYDVTIVTDTSAEIAKRDATITPNAAQKPYGAPDPDFTYTTSGLINASDLDPIVVMRKDPAAVDVIGGTYELTATYTENDNYNVTVTSGVYLTITETEFVVELVPEYIPNMSLVLVYSNAKDIDFKLDGTVMYKLVDSGYKYKDKDEYENVFALLIPYDEDNTETELAKVVELADGELGEISPIVTYPASANDVNASGQVDMRDIVAVISVYNKNATYLASYMQIVFRADVNRSKNVDTADAGIVKAEYLKDKIDD